MSDVPRELLRETLIGRLAPAPGACIDSERLAAWSEGTLHARDREAIERHASECGRCQALLAAMVRTAPPAAPSRWWRRSTFPLRSFRGGVGWVAPLAAAAAAILLWINVPRSPVVQSTPPAASLTAKSESPAGVAAPVPPAAPSNAPAAAPEPRPVETSRQARATSPRDTSSSATSQRELRPDDPASVAIPETKGALEPAGELAALGKTVVVEAPAAGKGAPPDSATTTPVAALPRAEAVTPSRFADTGPPAKFDAAGGGAGGRGGRLSMSPPEFVSPDASVRWRILPGGRVARSIDRGATWQTQSTGAAVTLTAGAAPTAAVCWLVGPGGTIVMSADGLTWQRVAPPAAVDLIAVRARDAATAIVTAADGRTYVTTDGGKSWRRP
jgi:hypothetical protein